MKKRIFCLILIAVCASGVNAQFRKIPSSVTDSFAIRYPHAEKVEWRDNITSFEAGFKFDGSDMKAGFSGDGAWKYTEKTITFDGLSNDVKDGFAKSRYADWKTGEVAEIQKPGKEIQYRVYAEKSSPFQKKMLYFSSNGQLLRDAVTF